MDAHLTTLFFAFCASWFSPYLNHISIVRWRLPRNRHVCYTLLDKAADMSVIHGSMVLRLDEFSQREASIMN